MLLRAISLRQLVVLCFLFSIFGLAQAQDKPTTFKAEDLAKEYRTDPDAFDKKHKGKQLRIEGVVNDTILAKSGIITLRGYLDKKEAPTHIQAYLAKAEKASAGKFKTSQKVTVEGTYPGAGSKFILVLENCNVAK